jgi:hypothetical protein
MVSIASEHGDVETMLVTGFRRRDAIVAPANGSLARSVGEVGTAGCSGGGVGGSKSFAASQSSSTNYMISQVLMCKRIISPCSDSF